jgi:ribosomal protein S18 acetylase RimI-like enzyme
MRYDKRISSSLMPYSIRELSLDELSAITDLRHAMIAEIEDEDLDTTSPGWRKRYVAFFQGHMSEGRGAVWAVEQQGRIIAMAAGYMPKNHRSAIVQSEQLYICNVYVKPEFRRKGIAKALTLHAVAWAGKHGCQVVRLRTSDMGRPLYASVGFEPSNEMELFL